MIKLDRKPIYQDTAPPVDYSLMSLDDIQLFPIEEYADDDCLLFLWAINGKAEKTPVIGFACDLIKEWGFKYHTLITWYKRQGMAFHSPVRTATEHIVFAWRGDFNSLVGANMAAMDSLFATSYQIRASEKPAKFYQLLRAWTPKPRIDLFARRAHEGFDGWGDEYVGEGPLMQYLEPEFIE